MFKARDRAMKLYIINEHSKKIQIKMHTIEGWYCKTCYFCKCIESFHQLKLYYFC